MGITGGSDGMSSCWKDLREAGWNKPTWRFLSRFAENHRHLYTWVRMTILTWEEASLRTWAVSSASLEYELPPGYRIPTSVPRSVRFSVPYISEQWTCIHHTSQSSERKWYKAKLGKEVTQSLSDLTALSIRLVSSQFLLSALWAMISWEIKVFLNSIQCLLRKLILNQVNLSYLFF